MHSNQAVLEQFHIASDVLLDAAPDAMVIASPDGIILLVNQQTERLFGFTRQELIGQPVEILVPKHLHGAHRRERDGYGLSPQIREMGTGRDLQAVRKDGTAFSVEISLSPVRTSGETVIVAAIRDVTARKLAERQLRLFGLAMESTTDSVVISTVHPDATVTFVNEGFCRLSGYQREDIVGRPLQELHRIVSSAAKLRQIARAFRRSESCHVEFVVHRKGNDPRYMECLAQPVPDPAGGSDHMLFVLRDATERHKVQQAIAYRAMHDTLTGLPNRALLADRLAQALAGAARSQSELAVLYMDLDRFKPINDVFGHRYGDLLLRELAPRLREILRQSDTIARLGGDEFAVVLQTGNLRDATAVARKILAALDAPFHLDGLDVTVGASIGIAVYPDHGFNHETLMEHADQAMYQAKQTHSGYTVFEPEAVPALRTARNARER